MDVSIVSEAEMLALGEQLKDEPRRGLLSYDALRYHLGAGDIVIDPFREQDLKTTSYDTRLGHYLFRQERSVERTHFNPFSESQVRAHWGVPREAQNAGEFMSKHGKLAGVTEENGIILLGPGETILAHTLEFIGGRNCVSTEMRARSSMGRIGVTVCKCAGWGDLGYVNRWTMEITNHLRETSLILVEGMRVAQLIFMKVDPIKMGKTYAGTGGKYQTTDDLEEMRKKWHPDGMLPKLYKDYETREGFPVDPIRVTL